MSFYQINPTQTEILYNTAIEMSGIDNCTEDIAFDLYCGIGTIGIFLSKYAKKVYGIEIVEQAIQDAKENAKINHIDNIEFLIGDVQYALEELIKKRNIKPNIVFVDPPRKGLDNATIENLKDIHPNKIVYISCNPATLTRDLAKMEDIYTIKKIQPVDMFPFTRSCGVLLGAMSKRLDEIVEFTAFEDFISFDRKGKNKVKRTENHKIKVKIEVDMVCRSSKYI